MVLLRLARGCGALLQPEHLQRARRTPHYPWAVWSRFEEAGYRLVWSMWTGTEWKDVGEVNGRVLGDELDPDIAFDPRGRPSLVWSREEGGVHRIYFSRFVKEGFLNPILVSDPTENFPLSWRTGYGGLGWSALVRNPWHEVIDYAMLMAST